MFERFLAGIAAMVCNMVYCCQLDYIDLHLMHVRFFHDRDQVVLRPKAHVFRVYHFISFFTIIQSACIVLRV
jgi:hypothetical protein